MKTELTPQEAAANGLTLEQGYWIKREGEYAAIAKALPNGNCPVGGDHFEVVKLNERRPGDFMWRPTSAQLLGHSPI